MQMQPAARHGRRPRSPENRRSAPVSALITPGEYAALVDVVVARDVSISDFIRAAVVAALPELADTAA